MNTIILNDYSNTIILNEYINTILLNEYINTIILNELQMYCTHIEYMHLTGLIKNFFF